MRFCLSKSTRIDTPRDNIGVGGRAGRRFRGATVAVLLRNGPRGDGIPKSRDAGRASWKPRQSSRYRHKVTNGSNGSGLRTVRPHITNGVHGAHLRQSTRCPLASNSRPESPRADQSLQRVQHPTAPTALRRKASTPRTLGSRLKQGVRARAAGLSKVL